jgi:hypothetical protein
MQEDQIEEHLYTHLMTLLAVSAGMVGVCLTAISLIGLFHLHSKLDTLLDEIVAVDSLLYVAVCLLIFLALRTPLKKRSSALALTVDLIFSLALVLTAIACGLLAWVVF